MPIFSHSLPSKSLLSHAVLLLPLPTFLFWGIKSSCALRKSSFNSSWLWSASLSLRTVSQEILYNNFLTSLKFAILKFRVLTLPGNHKLNQGMIAVAQAVSSLNIFNDLMCICEHHVQQHIISGQSAQYLNQKVITNGLQETLGSLEAHHVFPIDTMVAEILYQD